MLARVDAGGYITPPPKKMYTPGTDFDRMLNRAKGVWILGGYRFWVVTCCMLFFACHSVFIFSSVLAAWIIQILNLILNYTLLTLYMMVFLMTLVRHLLRNMKVSHWLTMMM